MRASGASKISVEKQRKRARVEAKRPRIQSRAHSSTTQQPIHDQTGATAARALSWLGYMAGGPSFQSLAVLQAHQGAGPNSSMSSDTAPGPNPQGHAAQSGPIKKRRKRGEADGKRYPCDQCEKCTYPHALGSVAAPVVGPPGKSHDGPTRLRGAVPRVATGALDYVVIQTDPVNVLVDSILEAGSSQQAQTQPQPEPDLRVYKVRRTARHKFAVALGRVLLTRRNGVATQVSEDVCSTRLAGPTYRSS